MSGASELSRDTLIDFLTGRGFDRDVLTNFCSDSWLLEIAERQLFANPDDEEEQEADEFVWVAEPPKEDQRDKIATEIERFLSEGGEVDELDGVDVDEPGEAGSNWAKERRVDD
jgi:hypothetical protein